MIKNLKVDVWGHHFSFSFVLLISDQLPLVTGLSQLTFTTDWKQNLLAASILSLNCLVMCPPTASTPIDVDFASTDENLFGSLERMIRGSPLPCNVINDVNPYNHRPSNLPGNSALSFFQVYSLYVLINFHHSTRYNLSSLSDLWCF